MIRYRLLPAALRPIAWLGIPLALGLAGAGFLGGALVVGSLLWLLVLSLAFVLRPPTAAGARTGSRYGLLSRGSQSGIAAVSS